MRPTWKGSISFGLVYIPISVYPATREEKLSFRQLRKTDLSPIKYKKVAESDMKEVAADQIVKGYEYEKGRYIVLSDEDFEKVRIESTHSIDITDFVDLPSKSAGQWSQGITPSMMKKMHWVNPEFVAQIKFAEWTRDGKLRQPVFLGLRQDKDSKKVVRES